MPPVLRSRTIPMANPNSVADIDHVLNASPFTPAQTLAVLPPTPSLPSNIPTPSPSTPPQNKMALEKRKLAYLPPELWLNIVPYAVPTLHNGGEPSFLKMICEQHKIGRPLCLPEHARKIYKEANLTLQNQADVLKLKNMRLRNILKIHHLRIIHPGTKIPGSETERIPELNLVAGQKAACWNNISTLTIDNTWEGREYNRSDGFLDPHRPSRPSMTASAIPLLRASKSITMLVAISQAPYSYDRDIEYYNSCLGCEGRRTVGRGVKGEKLIVWTWEKRDHSRLL
ncbi:hypothetical protein B0J14DRAFT_584927 [Halenospora varia]|nr:hypothetical protein B0J14DRAFT_584927 [Halenospora varia]